jgi:hypothetical protein
VVKAFHVLRIGLIATGNATVMAAMSVMRYNVICIVIDDGEVSLNGVGDWTKPWLL